MVLRIAKQENTAMTFEKQMKILARQKACFILRMRQHPRTFAGNFQEKTMALALKPS